MNQGKDREPKGTGKGRELRGRPKGWTTKKRSGENGRGSNLNKSSPPRTDINRSKSKEQKRPIVGYIVQGEGGKISVLLHPDSRVTPSQGGL